MRILLDHCVPRAFERELTDHDVVHTSRLEWGGLRNGMLLSAAEAGGFAAMITVDRSMKFQQNMSGRHLSIIVLHVPKNDISTLVKMADAILGQIPLLQPGTVLTLVHPSME